MHDGLTLTEAQVALHPRDAHLSERVAGSAAARFLPALSPAVVLAGERPGGDSLTPRGDGFGKAMAMIAGKPMIAHVIGTLARSGLVSEIIISSPSDLTGHAEIVQAAAGVPLRHAPTRGSICGSVQAAFDALPRGRGTLVTTADNPLLSVDTLADFLFRAAPHEGLSLGMVPERVIRAKYPHSKRTYYRFRDDAVSGANLFYFKGNATSRVLAFWERAESHRKKPWKIMGAFGWGTVFAMAARRLSVTEGFARAGGTLGCKVQAHLLREAEAAMDVDSQRDFIAAEHILEARQKQQTADPISPSQSIAVFDLDRTLTRRGTFTPFLLSTRRGLLPRAALMARLLRHMVRYKAGRITRLELKNHMLDITFKGFTRAEIEAAATRFAAHTLERGMRDGAALALAMHQMGGDRLVLATASIDLYAKPIAAALGISDIVCTETAFTGDAQSPIRVAGENCYGDEKFMRLYDSLLGAGKYTRNDLFISFYSDHHTDMPLFDWADVAVVVSPDAKTHAMALDREMKIVEW